MFPETSTLPNRVNVSVLNLYQTKRTTAKLCCANGATTADKNARRVQNDALSARSSMLIFYARPRFAAGSTLLLPLLARQSW